jgi:hypothetical protein
LKGASSARPENAARRRQRLTEIRRAENIAEPRIIPVGNAEDIRRVKDVENLDNRFEPD